MSRISHFSRILLLLTLALLPRLAQTQRIGPLGPPARQQSKALSTERTAAVGPPSLQLSLPPPAVVALPPLGPDDLQLLQPQEGQPPVIGIHRPLPPGSVSLSFSGGTARTTAEGAWQAIPAGRLWRLRITSPSARAMRVHFRDFAIGAGKLWLYSADGQTVGPYTGSGLYGDGNFWSDIVSGDSLTIEYLPDPVVTEEAVPFQIVEISHIWDGAFGGGGEAGVQPPIAASGGARTGREAAKLLTDWINVAVGTQSMEQSPAVDNLPDTKTARIAKQIQLVERSASLQQPRPKAARALTPGRPVSFSRGPVDSPTLFYGDFSYQLEVPEDATRVTFTLESVDPDIDMDLFVRYGEDNDFQNGMVVSDYSSEGLTGNEEIVITPQSDPPLRAGTYFVSVALFDTGVVAMATLTAELERDDTPLPPISGGTLTPGQPSAFRLGPVESPTLFNGDKSFRMEVPTGASRVIFTMESVDPDVDVDLYVRFGEDNMIQNGRPVFDHRSQKLTGNERIGITRRSDPPLRAGTYFVSVRVFDTGVVAEGTITATVETDAADCHLDATCYTEWSSSAAGVALIMIETSEGSSSCSGTLLNNSRQDFTPYFLTAAHCVDTEEEARSVITFWHYQTQTCNGELPGFQSVPRTMGASLLSTLGGGPIEGRAHPDGDMTLLGLEGDLPDGVMFQGWDAAPQPFGTQVTGIHHPRNDDWGFFKRLSFGQIIPDPGIGTSDDVYAIVRYTQGLVEGGSSGSALFSSPETVVGVQGFGPQNVYDCSDAPFYSGTTHFSVFYPHIRQFIDPLPTSLKISSGGIVLATGTPVVNRIAPNAIITVFGEDFAPAGTQVVSPQLDDGGKVATKLANTCLEIDGDRAPLFAVFPTQINAQAPHLLQPTQATVEVIRGCGTQDEQRSPAETVAVAPLAPAFFNFVSNPGGHNPIVALHGGGPGLVGESGLIPGVTFTPAQPNEFVSFFGTGFGPTDPALESGQIPSQALPNSRGVADLTNEVTFTIGGIAVPPKDVFYAGAAPCCAGLLQFVVRVPPNAPDGNLGVVATVGGVSTPDGPFITVMQPLGIPMLAPADEAAFNDLFVAKRAAVAALRDASPQARHHFTQADQVNQLVGASEADPDRGFMARLMALCSLPRTNPGNRHQYKRVNGPYKLIMFSNGDSKLPYGNLPRKHRLETS